MKKKSILLIGAFIIGIALVGPYCLPLKGTSVYSSSSVRSNIILRMLYTHPLGHLVRYGIKQTIFSRIIGLCCDLPLSVHLISPFIKQYAIDMQHSEKALHEFTTFNDFFTRRLLPHSRPIHADENSYVSPADGYIIAIENLQKSNTFPIKNQLFNLYTFLKNSQLADEYRGGTLLVIRLAPDNYHRFHFPCTCQPTSCTSINGKLDSVDPQAFIRVQPLHTNERKLIKLTTSGEPVLMVPVGALCVGKIITTYQPNVWHQKGEEAGYFCFGGSTIALIFKAGTILVNEDILINSAKGEETVIKMGEPMGLKL